MKKVILSLSLAALVGATIVGCNPGNEKAFATNNAPATSQKITWAFTQENQHPEQLLESVINSTNSTLDIAIYSLTERGIVSAIKKAEARGVKVRIVTDKQQAGGKSQAQELNYLSKAGIKIKENTHSGLMHNKISVADGKIVATGSFNYTASATKYNDENLVVIEDTKMAQAYENEFTRIWNDNVDYKFIN